MNEKIKMIHDGSMKILEQTGVRFHHEGIIDILKQNNIKLSGITAYFTEEQVMEWVGKAPDSFTVHARNPENDMFIGKDNVECGPGYGSTMVMDYYGNSRPGLLSDYHRFLKLFQQNDHFNVNGGILIQPSDLGLTPPLLAMLYSTIMLSDKCIFAGNAEKEETEKALELLKIVFGGEKNLIKQPRVITLANTSTPLQFHKTTLDTMLLYGQHNQPVIVTPAVMAGSTGPVTLAGTLALANAETLAGIAVTQMINPGTPVMYGSQSTASDMRTIGFAPGSPESGLCATYCARLAKSYGLPCRGGGTLNDAKSVSAQSGYESMMLFLIAHQEKMNLIMHSAGVIDSHNAMSFEQLIIDFEIIGMVKRYLRGIEVNNNTLALDLINEVGPGGHFVTASHTMENFKNELWLPEISIRGALHGEIAEERFMKNIRNKQDKMLSAYHQPELPGDMATEIKYFLTGAGVDKEILNVI